VAALDEDRDECISFSEFKTEDEETTDPLLAVVGIPQPDEDRPRPTASDLLRELNLAQALRMVQRYDRNRDRKLTAAEIGWDAERLQQLDADGNHTLDHAELLHLGEAAPDLELHVDLLGDGEQASLQVISSNTARQVPAPRPDLVRLQFGTTTVTFSFRRIDPLQRALESAMLVFNQMDQDGNGYIDRPEVDEDTRHRWERYLFDNMDRDGDEKVFAEEVQAYVATVCEPAGNTCHVNLYDTGQGFFQMMDANGDGRISIRELRTMDESLREHVNTPDGKIEPGDSGRHYHIEFVRGSYQLFGEPERMVAQGPTFIERPAVGPIWFQRMDRNSDGDLTYASQTAYGAEFLGPREAFHRLDVDGDGLVDAKEAERADQLWPNMFEVNTTE
jgi:Ca2+-binding EF-hand superfamily protein